jgi:hypothetical protein
MSDAAKYLPLSHREREDESSVSNDWSKHLYACLDSLAALAETLSPAQLETQTNQNGKTQYRVVDVATLAIWRLSTARVARLRRLLAEALRTRSGSAGATVALSRTLASTKPSPAALAAQLRQLAADGRASATRRSVADLSVAVVAGYDIARAAGAVLSVEPVASGAVALARSLSAPTEIRAVLRDTTLHATDDNWSVGHGATRNGTARDIVLFLWGRAGIPTIAADTATSGDS